MRNSFYEVPQNAWLFRKPPDPQDQDRSAGEELVRQWCLHELLRAYGISITCLTVEHPVKVARERHPHRIDILMLLNGKPYIVIECKARGEKAHEAAISQAINYASLPDVCAEFAVYTNGEVWWVRRRIREQWLPVADIPIFHDGNPNTDWRDILLAVDRVGPVLYWLDQVVPAKQAQLYFGALQQFFYARNELTAGTDRLLLRAADRVLRVLDDVNRHPNYLGEKMSHACDGINKYWKKRGVEPTFGGGDLWEMAHHAWADLSNLLDDTRDIVTLDYQAMRLILSLLDYLNQMKDRRIRYQDVGPAVQSEIRAYLDIALIVRFNSRLPNPNHLDTILIEDVHRFCKPVWDRYVRSKRAWPGLGNE